MQIAIASGLGQLTGHFVAQQRFRVEKKDFWMVRITDVGRALVARGYPRGPETRLTLDLRDPLIPTSSGAWQLSVSKGAANVERVAGSAKALRLDVRGLAAIFSGLVTPRQGVALGWADGDAESLDAAEALFTGSTPWMTDHF